MAVNNYTLGRGSLFLEPFAPGTQNPAGGERFFGDCNAIGFTLKSTDLDHYGSTSGIKELDASIPLQVDRTGAFTTENISPENLALFFLGSSSLIAQTSQTIAAEAINGVAVDRYYQLGATVANPSGNRGLDMTTAPTVTDDAGTPHSYVAGTDFTIDLDSGALYVIPGGGIVAGTNLRVTYKLKAGSRDHVVSGGTPVEGLLRFRGANPAGAVRDAVAPWVRISPNGSFDLIGDKFTALQFDVKVLKKNGTGGEALYLDGRAISA